MTTQIELAVRAYRPSDENDIALPGWTVNGLLSPSNRGSGFDGTVFEHHPNGGPFAHQHHL